MKANKILLSKIKQRCNCKHEDVDLDEFLDNQIFTLDIKKYSTDYQAEFYKKLVQDFTIGETYTIADEEGKIITGECIDYNKKTGRVTLNK